jgi:hypothetical protein
MPRVPQYDNQTVGLSGPSNAQYQAPNAPDVASQNIKNTSEALQSVGEGLGRIAFDKMNEVNNVRADAAKTEFDRSLGTLKNDPNNGYSVKKGINALEPGGTEDKRPLHDIYGEMAGKKAQELRDSLGNDAQKKLFDDYAGKRTAEFTIGIQEHVAKEYEAYKASQIKGRVELGQQTMAQNYDDPIMVANARQNIIDAVDSINGMSPEEKQAKKTDMLSVGHSAVISAMIEHDAGAAREYFKKVDSELTPQDRKHLREALKIGDMRERSQAFADDALAKNMTQQEALAAARAKFSGKEEDDAVHEVNSRFAEHEQIKSRDVKAVSSESWSSVMETGRMPPATLLTKLREVAPETERQIRDWLDVKRRRDADPAMKTDRDVQYKLMRMAVDDPYKFAQMDLREVSPYLDKGDWNHMTSMQASINKNDAKSMQTQESFKRAIKDLAPMLHEAKIDLNAKKGPEAEKAQEFYIANIKDFEAFEIKNGHSPSPEESRKIIAGNARLYYKPGRFFDDKERGYKIPDEERSGYVVARFDKIPLAIRNSIVNPYLSAARKTELSDEDKSQIERFYTEQVRKGVYK